VATDINGDGYPDVLIGFSRDDTLGTGPASTIFYGPFLDVDGTGTAPADEQALSSSGVGKVATGDFDGDGAMDLVLGGVVTGESVVDVYYADAIAGGAPSRSIGVDIVSDLLAADLNQDGYDDLVFCQRPAPSEPWGFSLNVFYGSSRGLVEGEGVLADAELTDCVDIEAGNLDSDPELEIVLARNRASSEERHMSVWADTTDGQTYEFGGEFEVVAATSVQLVDLNGDDHLDAVFGAGLDEGDDPDASDDSWETNVEVYLGSADGLSTVPHAVLPGDGSAHPLLADFNGNGFVDILAPGQANNSGGTIYTRLYWSSDGSFSPDVFLELTWSAWVHGAVAYTNEDEFLDVLRFSEDPVEGLVRQQGSPEGLTNSSQSPVSPNGTSVSPPIVVD
jgi:hypothetical protein